METRDRTLDPGHIQIRSIGLLCVSFHSQIVIQILVLCQSCPLSCSISLVYRSSER